MKLKYLAAAAFCSFGLCTSVTLAQSDENKSTIDGTADESNADSNSESTIDHSTIDQCNQYNGYPTYCMNTPGCFYDNTSGYCYTRNPGPGPGPGPGPNPNPNPGPGPWPGPGPNQCNRYNYDPRMCNSIYGCQYDYRFNVCNPTGTLPPPPPPPPPHVGRGWCAGGIRMPSFVLRDQYEAYACARQIAAGGWDCARYATYGICDTAGYGPGFRADPSVGWCQCNRRPHFGSPLRWSGPTYNPYYY